MDKNGMNLFIIWVSPKQRNQDGLFWFKAAIGTQYVKKKKQQELQF